MIRILLYALAAVTLLGGVGIGVQTVRLAHCERAAAVMEKAWAEAAQQAIRKVLLEERQRNRVSEAAADEMRAQTDSVLPVMQADTAAAAERVRTVIRTIELPANCPTTLPAAVVAEGQAAVERARRAGQ